MKALFIGGTGTISSAIVACLAKNPEWEVWLLNRGNRNADVPDGVHTITADIHDEADVSAKLKDQSFDCICEFIGFTREDVERDVRLFEGRCHQYIYISSASAYHKPSRNYLITEGATLANPYWQYSQNKIACEDFLMQKYREDGFPVTIVRPSHTYDRRSVPVGVHGRNGSWQVLRRMMLGKPVIIQGDGTSLWALTASEDFATGYIGLMGNRHAIGEAFQITGDEILTWNQIHETIADALGVELHPYYVASETLAAMGDPLGYGFGGSLIGDKSVSVVFDNTKLKRLVPQMTTTIPFHIGVRQAIRYIQGHPETCQRPDMEFDDWCDHVIEAQEQAKAKVLACYGRV